MCYEADFIYVSKIPEDFLSLKVRTFPLLHGVPIPMSLHLRYGKPVEPSLKKKDRYARAFQNTACTFDDGYYHYVSLEDNYSQKKLMIQSPESIHSINNKQTAID